MEPSANPGIGARMFKAGQLWKTENGYILITVLGDRMVGYKKLRNPNQRVALAHLIRPEALACYLQKTDAVLQQ